MCRCVVESHGLVWMVNNNVPRFFSTKYNVSDTMNITNQAEATLVSKNNTHLVSVLVLEVQSVDIVVCKDGPRGAPSEVTLVAAGEY